MFRRKVAALLIVFLLLGTLVTVRFITGKKESASDSHALTGAVYHLKETAETTQAAADIRAVQEALFAAADLHTDTYRPVVALTKSADAASFFDGYTPVTTADTVFLPGNPGAVIYTQGGDRMQGASDAYDATEDTESLSMDDIFLDSESAVLVDLDTGEIVAARNADAVIYPASMTKIMTLLTANEQLTDRGATFTITQDITDLTFSESLSSVCWDVGETVTVDDLEYGTILPSGADAAIGLARVAAGSEEALVDLMNDKAKAMHLSDAAHFTNVTGMFDEDNVCTVTDMAMIMKAAAEYDHVLDVLQTREYTTSRTAEHPDGVYMFNLFLDRSDLREMPGTLICAKTGYTDEALNCAASYFVSDSGKHYVCVTALGHGSRRVVTDHVNLYTAYTKK